MLAGSPVRACARARAVPQRAACPINAFGPRVVTSEANFISLS